MATSWTVPLQYSVAGWFALQAFWSATLPFWVGGQVTEMFVQAVHRQQQLDRYRQARAVGDGQGTARRRRG